LFTSRQNEIEATNPTIEKRFSNEEPAEMEAEIEAKPKSVSKKIGKNGSGKNK
jgi:hypothetical protein